MFWLCLGKVNRFNASQPLPDAMQGTQNMSGSVGQTQRGAEMTELLEKQVDLAAHRCDCPYANPLVSCCRRI